MSMLNDDTKIQIIPRYIQNSNSKTDINNGNSKEETSTYQKKLRKIRSLRGQKVTTKILVSEPCYR